MNQNDIQSLLEEALEREIPSSQVDLWTAVKAELVVGNHLESRKGEKMNTRKRAQTVFVFAGIVMLLALAFISPQGRAFAQDVRNSSRARRVTATTWSPRI